MKRLLLSLSFILLSLCVKGQGYLSFYQLRDIVPQTGNLQPAFIPDNTFSISLIPNFGVNVQGNWKLEEILSRPNGQNELTVDFGLLSEATNGQDHFNFDLTVNLLHMALKTKIGGFSFFVNSKTNFDFRYNKDFIDFLANGNGNFIGETIDFGGNRIKLESLQEIGLGHARQFMDGKLTVGLRAKLVTGIFHASLEENAVGSLTTSADDFSWQIAFQNATVNTAGLDFLFNEDDYNDDEFTEYLTGNQNSTIAFDIGAKYKVLSWLEAEFAINDIGSINWKEQVRNYNIEDNTVTFRGIDLKGLEDSDQVFEDSLTSRFVSNETRRAFKTPLSKRIFLTGSAYLTPNDRFSLTYFKRTAADNLPANYAVSYNHRFDKFVVGLTGLYRGSGQEFNMGLNLGTNIGPVQLYVATDNMFVFNRPERFSKADFRFGLNLMFGYKKWRPKEEVVDLDKL